MKKSSKLILMRHGQSEWNRLNLFTGWVDVPLSQKGIEEAIKGGKQIAHLPIDVIYTSSLVRAHMTAMLAMLSHSSGRAPCFVREEEPEFTGWTKIHGEKAKELIIPVYAAWQLNERMYGDLQGLNKQESREKFGESQVHIWRRSFDQAPPNGESLKNTAERTLPYFEKEIVPQLQAGRNVFVSAHGNSLRAIVMDLENLSKEEVMQLEIPTGRPLVYTWSESGWLKDE